ncbi:MAG TPA: phosphate ABC transporter permease PtsA, partial [Acidobacteriota bacterium]|nr:phosphate ABC transporter permease PtsA [Acidobacteriota bacterium]
MDKHYRYRKFVERANWFGMLGCISVSVFFLVAILGYVLVNGASYIDWEFLTAIPVPAGESGGGIANALVGSLLVVALAAVM